MAPGVTLPGTLSSVAASRLLEEIDMRKLNVFNNVSLDGYFTDAHGDMLWYQPTES